MGNNVVTQADRDTTIKMKERTTANLCAVYGAIGLAEGELVGSGTLVNFSGETWLITANHVLREKNAVTTSGERRFIALAASKGDGEVPGVIADDFYGWSKPLDVAATSLGRQLWSAAHTPLEAWALGRSSIGVEGAHLFIHGFPGARSRVFSFGVASRSLPYLSGAGGEPTAIWFNSKHHFTIDYSPTTLADELGVPADLVDPHGLSGSAVWAVNGYADVPNWKATNARVVGIVTSWDQDRQLLIATRIEAVRELMLTTLRRRFAFARWKARRKPEADDWSDWFEAVEELRELSLTEEWLTDSFALFDERLFGGRLAQGTKVELLTIPSSSNVALEQTDNAVCKNDGSIIFINPTQNHDWRRSLIHEMIHAFEFRFPMEIVESDEGRAAKKRHGGSVLIGQHSAKFFTKLFEVMRSMGHEPSEHFDSYFA